MTTKSISFKMLIPIFATIACVSGPALASPGPNGIGGLPMDTGCYNGNFIPNKLCYLVNVEASLTGFRLKTQAEVYVKEKVPNASNGQTDTSVSLTLTLIDDNNFFNPEASLPVLVRAIKAKTYRDTFYSVESYATQFTRLEGTRTLVAKLNLSTSSFPGAEFTENVRKLEVLIPGVAGTMVVDFKFAQ